MNCISKLFIIAPLLCANAANAHAGDLLEVVNKFLAAETHFDPKAMETEMCREYSEISPVGDLDNRNQVLSFYESKNKVNVDLVSSVIEQYFIGNNPVLIEKLYYSFYIGAKKETQF